MTFVPNAPPRSGSWQDNLLVSTCWLHRAKLYLVLGRPSFKASLAIAVHSSMVAESTGFLLWLLLKRDMALQCLLLSNRDFQIMRIFPLRSSCHLKQLRSHDVEGACLIDSERCLWSRSNTDGTSLAPHLRQWTWQISLRRPFAEWYLIQWARPTLDCFSPLRARQHDQTVVTHTRGTPSSY